MSLLEDRNLTARDFSNLSATNAHCELVHGKIIQGSMPGGRHGAIVVIFGSMLCKWTEQFGGCASMKAGYELAHDPDTVRGPDVSFVRQERIPADGVPEAFWPIVPDLAVEVISPNDTEQELRDKVVDFLSAGTSYVAVVYPRTREIIVHTPNGVAQTYSGEQLVELSSALPGFSFKVEELFA